MYLREHFADDLFRSLGLARDFVETGVERLDVADAPDWATLFAGASRIQCLVIDAGEWLSKQWPEVMSATQARRVSVSVYAPDPAHSEFEQIAQRYDIGPAALTANVEELRRRIEQEWNTARQGSSAQQVDPKSEIRLKYYRGVPSFSVTLADRRGAIAFYQSLGNRQGEDSLVVTLSAESESSIVVWCRRQLDSLEQFPDQFYGAGS